MKINEILECFDKALDNGNHYIIRSFWERKIGTLKQITSIIYLLDPDKTTSEFVKVEHVYAVNSGQEEEYVEENQKRALVEFIKKITNDTGVK